MHGERKTAKPHQRRLRSIASQIRRARATIVRVGATKPLVEKTELLAT
jgi:hypothetical protein